MVDVVISSGHGKYIRGAEGPKPWGLDEVNEARRIVEEVALQLRKLGAKVITFHDDVSDNQEENLNRIVDFHNASLPHKLDVSVHLNCSNATSEPMGCEVYYKTQEDLARKVSGAIADAGGFRDRGGKLGNYYFLNHTIAPALLLEICFVDSEADVSLYHQHFDEICKAIAIALPDVETAPEIVPPPRREPEFTTAFSGPCSWFGGPEDDGVSPSEGLAFIYELDDAPGLFLPQQPPGTTGLARRLDPDKFYVACRWDYDITPKEMLADQNLVAIVRAVETGKTLLARPADWGPHEDTGRAADLSPGLLEALQLSTDDEVLVLYPFPAPDRT
jgi:N-acetylmuramoyl-L-alanine amidase